MAESPAVIVRAMRREDAPAVLRMIFELASYEGVPDGPKLTADDLVKDGFDSDPPWFFGLVAERGSELVGHALCTRAYSSWSRQALYVEDLFVYPNERRTGIGFLIMQHLCKMALELGVNRIDWHVLKSNSSALCFYRRLGALDLRDVEGRAALRLFRDRIEATAAGQLNQ